MASHHQAMPQRHDEILKWDVVPEGTSHPEEEAKCVCTRAGKIPWWVKHFMCQREDPSSDSQQPAKEPGIAAYL